MNETNYQYELRMKELGLCRLDFISPLTHAYLTFLIEFSYLDNGDEPCLIYADNEVSIYLHTLQYQCGANFVEVNFHVNGHLLSFPLPSASLLHLAPPPDRVSHRHCYRVDIAIR